MSHSPAVRSELTPPDLSTPLGLAPSLARRLGRAAMAMLASAEAWTARLPRLTALSMAIGLMACVGLADRLTGADVSFTLLYLGPIGLASWFVSLRAGILLSTVSALVSSAADLDARSRALSVGVLAWNVAVQLGVFLALTLLFAALKGRLEAEQQLARTDPLTHVANRRAFVEQAGVELERARRTGRPITVAYLDCDDFKVINDRFGHAQGDLLLAAAAATLRGGTRAVDTVARLGGDEFGLLWVDTDGPTAEALTARIRAALQGTMAGYGWIVTFSIGAVTFLSPPGSVDDMLGHADQLMYEAKRSGKDTARFKVIGTQLSLALEKAS